jgi:hypothetical protein
MTDVLFKRVLSSYYPDAVLNAGLREGANQPI